MTDAPSDLNEDWRAYIGDDPHAPIDVPAPESEPEEEDPVEDPEEEDPVEDPEEEIPETDPEDPGEDPEEYFPYGYLSESDNSQDLIESLTDDEITPPPPPQRPMRCCPEGNCPLTRRTTRMSVPPATQRDELGFVPFPFRGPQPYRHFEIGGPSQAPPPSVAPSPPPAPAVTPPRDVPTMAQHRQVVNQVLQLEDRRTEDSDAIQTLYCRVGADRSHANTMGAHIRGLEFRLEIAERELRLSERERLQMRGQLTELTRYIRRRLG